MTTDPAHLPDAPWPGGGAEAVGAPATIDAFALDGELRAFAHRAVEERPATIDADPWRQAFHVQPPQIRQSSQRSNVRHASATQVEPHKIV